MMTTIDDDDAEREQRRRKSKSRNPRQPPVSVHHAQLRTLDLSFSVLDADLAVLSACRLPALRVLDLSCTPLKPEALHALERFPQLQILSLHQTLRDTLAERAPGHSAAFDDDDSGDNDSGDGDDGDESRDERREAEDVGEADKKQKNEKGASETAESHQPEARADAGGGCRLPALASLRYLDFYHGECGGCMTRNDRRWAALYPALEHLRPSDTRFQVLQRLTTLTSLDMTRDRTEPLPSMRALVAHLPRLRTLVLPTRLATRRVIPLYGRPAARVRDTASQMRAEAGLDLAPLVTVLVAKCKSRTAQESRERLKREADEADGRAFEGQDESGDAEYPWSALERRARDTGVCLSRAAC
jgi:hypothetical protein